VSAWGRHLDDLAGAVTQLLHDGAAHPAALINPMSTLAARDAVVVQLRELVGAVADVPTVAAVRELTLHDAVHRPSQSLHQALSELPRAISFGEVELPAGPDERLTDFERTWQQAARSTLALEAYVDALGHLPDHVAWDVLRDLTDLAAALPYLDHDLSEAVLPLLKQGHDLGVPYVMLTHPAHAFLRTVSTELRARVPAAEPASRGRPQLPVSEKSAAHQGALAAGRASPRARRGGAASPPVEHRPGGAGELAEAMIRYGHAVSSCGSNLAVADLRAATRLLEFGSAHAGQVLERAAAALEGAQEAAVGLYAVAPLAHDLRAVPVTAMPQPHLPLVRVASELQARLKALAGQAARSSGDTAMQGLRQLSAQALEYAQHAPALAAALDLSVREAVANGLMLVPGSLDRQSDLSVSWVTARMGAPSREGPPQILLRAGELSAGARRIAPVVHVALQHLARHSTSAGPAEQAAQAARGHAGAARQELRAALATRIAFQPAVLAPELPAHPRLAPPPRATGFRR
jgi:hypothetical protein